jgi:ligand-binding SRPBCC domain-containing protein
MTLEIKRNPSGPGYLLMSEVFLPRPREEVFHFFSDAFQLESLTPPWLKFQVLTPPPIELKPGAVIDYRLRVHGLPLRWRSEITAWEPPLRFVDEQRRGPYRHWIHEHVFEERDGGTLARDIVRYGVPGGGLVHALFVGRDVRKIFEYRAKKLREVFGGKNELRP